LVRALLQSLIM